MRGTIHGTLGEFFEFADGISEAKQMLTPEMEELFKEIPFKYTIEFRKTGLVRIICDIPPSNDAK